MTRKWAGSTELSAAARRRTDVWFDSASVDDEAVTGVSESGVPAEALRFFARWWRLESYLRDLTYTELRVHDGVDFAEGIDPQALRRAEKDRINDYVPSADAEDVLAYLDAGQLLDLIDDRWALFEETLLPQSRWKPKIEELRSLRNRISHCRRPHSRDLPRLDMLLEDLERGAQRFFSSYNDTSCEINPEDPFARAWIGARHERAGLIEHARDDYWTRMHVRLSRRPWAAGPEGARVDGEPGYLWHVDWTMDSRRISPRALWESLEGSPETKEQVVHLLFANPYRVGATFAAVDDPEAGADAVGRLFEAVCEEAEWYESDDLDAAIDWSAWRAEGRDLPRKVQIETPLASFDPYNPRPVFDEQA
jgi:hypothetical protein